MAKYGMSPVRPGEMLREDHPVPLGVSAHELAKVLNVPAPRITDSVRKRRGISADRALRLARHFDTTARFWLALQARYELRVADKAAGESLRQPVPVMERAAEDKLMPRSATPSQWMSSFGHREHSRQTKFDISGQSDAARNTRVHSSGQKEQCRHSTKGPADSNEVPTEPFVAPIRANVSPIRAIVRPAQGIEGGWVCNRQPAGASLRRHSAMHARVKAAEPGG